MKPERKPGGKIISRLMNGELEDDDIEAIKNLILHSWEPIDYDYVRLTPGEKQLITEDQFKRVADWAKND